MNGVRDIYLEKLAAEESEKKPMGNITSKLGLKSNNLAELKPIQEEPHREETYTPSNHQMKPYNQGQADVAHLQLSDHFQS